MKLLVNPHTIEIKKDLVNEKEIDVTKCEFEFADEITNDYVKEAYFTYNGTSYKQIITNNQCDIPGEVLQEKGQVEIGVVAYLVESEEEIKRYNPSPAYFSTMGGSLKENAENSEPITPSEMEQFEQILEDGLNEVANVDIDAEQTSTGANITITDRDGISKTVYVYNGEKGDKGDKGDKGEQGIQGIQGIPGKDGLNGQDGKDGKDGKDGADGQPGTPGADGKDGINGTDGQDGADATINGVNTLTLQAGSNISLDQQGSTMTISATGGSGGTSDYTDLTNKPSINNITLSGNKTTSDLGLFSGDYTDLSNKPTIPTKTSDLTNDSNFVSNVYSSINETIVGKWIDDKTIYRKVYSFTVDTATTNYTIDVNNIDTVTNLRGISELSSGETHFLPHVTSNNAYNQGIYYTKSNKQISVKNGSSVTLGYPVKAIIEYTKTTD